MSNSPRRRITSVQRHLCRPLVQALEERRLLTTFVVSNPNATDDLTSLQGILASPTLAPGDVITFDNAKVSTIFTDGSFFVPAGITITNTGNTPITIEGNGSHNDFEILPIDASNVQDPNNFSDPSTTTLNGLNIIGGGLGSDVEISSVAVVFISARWVNKNALVAQRITAIARSTKTGPSPPATARLRGARAEESITVRMERSRCSTARFPTMVGWCDRRWYSSPPPA